MLPISLPRIGDSASPSSSSPSSSVAKRTISSLASSRSPSSRTRPPGALPLPTSNCGLMSATIRPPGASTSAIGGRMSFREMNETSVTATSGTSGRSSAFMKRAL